ncbi:hypothetical protein KC950_03150 [Candidatus Saccharibacteria bacterium]|nr:hypothetical protein [Candidatus Saccharibacteria bacterium]
MPWNRNRQPKVDVQVPPEVEEYYQSTQKDRRGMAWLLAFATLILTILIAVVIFFVGRWAYNTVFGDDSDTNSSQELDNQSGSEENRSQSNSDDGASASDDALESPETTNNTGTNQETLPSDTDSQNNSNESGATGANNNASNVPGSTGSTGQTPTTGPGDSEIPRTGPTEE